MGGLPQPVQGMPSRGLLLPPYVPRIQGSFASSWVGVAAQTAECLLPAPHKEVAPAPGMSVAHVSGWKRKSVVVRGEAMPGAWCGAEVELDQQGWVPVTAMPGHANQERR